MISYFCDTSALAKFYVHEKESEAIIKALDQCDQVFASDLAKAELAAVFHKKYREGAWDKKKFNAVFQQFESDLSNQYWTWIPLSTEISEAVIETYSTLPKTVFLRTADCFHLVTAIQSGFKQIVTYDKHQQIAAKSISLEVIQF